MRATQVAATAAGPGRCGTWRDSAVTAVGRDLDWEVLDDLDLLVVPTEDLALIALGMDGCKPCEVVRHQIATFASEHPGVSARLFKFCVKGRPPQQSLLLGEELRFFPTVIGFVEGELAFRMQGVLADAKPSDASRLEKGFARFIARRLRS